jgi:hypothetical protein
VKTVACIDGGTLVVRDETDVARLHEMRLIGMNRGLRTCAGTNRVRVVSLQDRNC